MDWHWLRHFWCPYMPACTTLFYFSHSHLSPFTLKSHLGIGRTNENKTNENTCVDDRLEHNEPYAHVHRLRKWWQRGCACMRVVVAHETGCRWHFDSIEMTEEKDAVCCEPERAVPTNFSSITLWRRIFVLLLLSFGPFSMLLTGTQHWNPFTGRQQQRQPTKTHSPRLGNFPMVFFSRSVHIIRIKGQNEQNCTGPICPCAIFRKQLAKNINWMALSIIIVHMDFDGTWKYIHFQNGMFFFSSESWSALHWKSNEHFKRFGKYKYLWCVQHKNPISTELQLRQRNVPLILNF